MAYLDLLIQTASTKIQIRPCHYRRPLDLHKESSPPFMRSFWTWCLRYNNSMAMMNSATTSSGPLRTNRDPNHAKRIIQESRTHPRMVMEPSLKYGLPGTPLYGKCLCGKHYYVKINAKMMDGP
ncbi:unnamed protein product [Absidia cylindrospora]